MSSGEQPTSIQKQGMRNGIIAQCFAICAEFIISHGALFVYLTSLDISRSKILVYLGIPHIVYFTLGLLAAYYVDIHGPKKLGIPGAILEILGFGMILVSTFTPTSLAEVLIITGLVLYGIGWCLYYGGWFTIMDPHVPSDMRGRFWGKLRLSWQASSIVVVALCAWYLGDNASPAQFRIVFGAIILLLAVRIYFYMQIPEHGIKRVKAQGFFKAFGFILRIPNYLSYCSYIFLLFLLTGSVMTLFNLIEKKSLGFTDAQIVFMGNVGMAGAVCGYALGGHLVDRLGTKLIFLCGHFTFALIIVTFVFRAPFDTYILPFAGCCHFAYGLIHAILSIAITAELLAMVPQENKSLSTTFCPTIQFGAAAISGMIHAAILKLGFLQENWTWLGSALSDVDALLIVTALMICMIVITLGLVPSVVVKARNIGSWR